MLDVIVTCCELSDISKTNYHGMKCMFYIVEERFFFDTYDHMPCGRNEEITKRRKVTANS